jgi:hypothetical protein
MARKLLIAAALCAVALFSPLGGTAQARVHVAAHARVGGHFGGRVAVGFGVHRGAFVRARFGRPWHRWGWGWRGGWGWGPWWGWHRRGWRPAVWWGYPYWYGRPSYATYYMPAPVYPYRRVVVHHPVVHHVAAAPCHCVCCR